MKRALEPNAVSKGGVPVFAGMPPFHFRWGLAKEGVAIAHFRLRKGRRDALRLNRSQVALEEDEDDFPLKLGLRS